MSYQNEDTKKEGKDRDFISNAPNTNYQMSRRSKKATAEEVKMLIFFKKYTTNTFCKIHHKMILDVPPSCDFPYVKPLSENQAMPIKLASEK